MFSRDFDNCWTLDLFFAFFISCICSIAIFKTCIYRTDGEILIKIALSKLIDKYLAIRLCLSDTWIPLKEIYDLEPIVRMLNYR